MQAGLAALALALGGGALLLLSIRLGSALAARRGAAEAGRTAALLWRVAEALGDPALLLDGRGRIIAANAPARARLPGVAGAVGRSVEELLGAEVALLRRGLGRRAASGRLALEPAGVTAVVARAWARPARELLVLRFDEARPPPLPARPLLHDRRRSPGRPAPLDVSAVGAALLRPIERASTAAGLLRLSLPTEAGRELARIEAELADLERRLRWLHAAGRELRREGPVDLSALVGDLLDKALPVPARRGAQLRPARAWADAARLRTALREVLRVAAGELPLGAGLEVRVGVRGGRAVLELATAAEASEAAALARALVVPEGGEVEVDVRAGRGSLCRLSFPSAPPENEPEPAPGPGARRGSGLQI